MLYALLTFTKKYLDLGKSLSEVFFDFARLHGYTAKSIKKCFVATLKALKTNPRFAKKFDVDVAELSNPANVFNMSAVKNYLCRHGGDTDKGFFCLCFGDKTEALALKKRFEKFFPDFCIQRHQEEQAKPNFVLNLQARYFDLGQTTAPRV